MPLARGADLKQVKGQESAKRALEIAAAGGHNLLMVGPPGAGKSLMASCMPGILPALTPAEALGVSMLASVAGTLQDGRMSRARPYRRSEEPTSELQSPMRISSAVFCLKKKKLTDSNRPSRPQAALVEYQGRANI